MLDLLISYVNFIILSIGYIVKRFTFFPPTPPHYKSTSTENDNEEDILFLFEFNKKNKKKKPKYIGIEFNLVDFKFKKIIDGENNNILPLLIFHPHSHLPICIIYSHGNSGDLGSCLLEYYDIAVNTNCCVVSFEYPGYGECRNQPKKESEFYRNLKITYNFVKKVLKFEPSQIILYGFSLGTGIMFEIACKKEFAAAGLILQSPFLSIVRTLYDINFTAYFDFFNNCDKAKYLKIKTLFIHGNKDHMVPYIHGRILAKLIPQKYYYDFLTVDNADHNNIFKGNKDLIYETIRKFIEDCTGISYDSYENKKDNNNNHSKSSENTLKNYDNNDDQNYNVEVNKKIIKKETKKKPSLYIANNNNKCQNFCLNNLLNNQLRILMDSNYNFNNNFYPSKLYNINKYYNQNTAFNSNYQLKNRNYISNLPNLKQLVENNYQYHLNNKSCTQNSLTRFIINRNYNENSYNNSTINNINNSM